MDDESWNWWVERLPPAERDALKAARARHKRGIQRLQDFVTAQLAKGGTWTDDDFKRYDELVARIDKDEEE